MAVMTSKLFSTSVRARLLDGVRGFVGGSQDAPERAAPTAKAPSPEAKPSIDQSRYARLLEHELDKQLLSEVEREDSEMLARVRSALYADD